MSCMHHLLPLLYVALCYNIIPATVDDEHEKTAGAYCKVVLPNQQ